MGDLQEQGAPAGEEQRGFAMHAPADAVGCEEALGGIDLAPGGIAQPRHIIAGQPAPASHGAFWRRQRVESKSVMECGSSLPLWRGWGRRVLPPLRPTPKR